MNAVEQRNQMLKEKFSKEVTEARNNTKFPADAVPNNFRQVLNKVLCTKCPRTMQCSWEMMRSLIVDDVRSFSMEQMGVALNAIENTTAKEYEGTLDDYIFLMDRQEEMARVWNEIWTPLVTEIQNRYKNIPPLFIPHKKK